MLAAPGSAAPAWSVNAEAITHVTPGGTFDVFVTAKNIGDSDSDGSEALTIDLQDGVVGASVQDPVGWWSCSDPVGASTITCTPVAAFATGEERTIQVTVSVPADASNLLRSVFEMTGGGAALVAQKVRTVAAVPSLPGFGVSAFDGASTDAVGDPYTQAAGHPYAISTIIEFNTVVDPIFGSPWPAEPAKDIFVDLPPGLVGNPTAAALCPVTQLTMDAATGDLGPRCPAASQVGVATVLAGPAGGAFSSIVDLPVFNMVPPPNAPARFGMNALGTLVTLDGQLRTGGDYGVSVNVRNLSGGLAITGTKLTFWGVPAHPSHDAQRSCPGQERPSFGGPSCSTDAEPKPFLRNPTACTPDGVGLTTSLRTDSWFDPGDFKAAAFVTHLAPGLSSEPDPALWGPPQGPTGCADVPFDPTLVGSPGSPVKTNTPSGFTFELAIPQTEDANVLDQSDLRKAVVTLPEGVRVSPASADGLGACTPDQIRLDSASDATCPDGSKIGTVEIETPLLEESVPGAIYLATPHQNPSGTLLALYLVAQGSGVTVKLAGKVEADPVTGRLTATFDNNPQTPFSKVRLQFEGGPRAALVTPPKCGTYATHAELTGWSGTTVSSDSSFTVLRNSKNQPCASPGFAPGFLAASLNPVAGKHSDLMIAVTRADDDQELGSLNVTMPQGVLAKIAGVPLCPDTQAASGTCGEGSRIGSVTVGAGAGPSPFYIDTGRVYLTGPYKGGPFGLSIVVPAVAGPFDLGDVVVRASLQVDRRTAILRAVSDPFPTILQGIPLQVRDVRVAIDRERFMVNPTSCARKRVSGTIVSVEGTKAEVSNRFQVGECGELGFKPRLRLTVGGKGHTRARSSTPLVARLTQGPGQVALKSVGVTLPLSLNALLPVVNEACTRAEYDAGKCEKARTGSAVAETRLLDKPLKGSVYFVKTPSGKGLPNIVVALRGQVDFDLVGTIKIPGGTRLATTFKSVPDVPIKSFTLRLVAGKDGAVGVAENLCTKKAQRAPAHVVIRGQDGSVQRKSQRLDIRGCSAKGAGKHKG